MIIVLSLYSTCVYADCTTEEINSLKKETEKIKITYKHLGEVTREDGSINYNDFLVTAKNIPNDVYVHLYPMTDSNFTLKDDSLQIVLTSGNWVYNLYSSKCDDIINEINVHIPTFNIYSLDPLCDGVDENLFKLCGKYYEYSVSREDFERRVNQYRLIHNINNSSSLPEDKNNNIFDSVLRFIRDYLVYFIILFGVIFIIFGISFYLKKRKNKNVLE